MIRRIALAGLILSTLAGSAPTPGLSQQSATAVDRAGVLDAIEVFFSSMTAKDVEMAKSVLEPQGRFFSARTARDGTRSVRTFTNQEYLDGLAGGTAIQRERIWDPQVLVHGDIASVWAPYDFHVDGAFSHCGVDSFDLIRTADGWKITGGVYTVQPEGCAPSPLGPVNP